MADPQTVNKLLNQPIPGTDVGTWGTPINNNFGIIDNSFGGVATIALTNSPVTLSPTQYQCCFIRFTGAISANIAITMPAVGSFYRIINDTTNSSAFILTMGTTAVGSQSIGLPPNTVTPIFTDGSNVRFDCLPAVGSYWDYAGSSVPLWLQNCTVPPWLNCDGTSFSSATYPGLAALWAGTTLPDSKGRARSALNQGSNRLLSSNNGVDGNTFSAGGGGSVTLSQAQLPSYNLPVTDPGHSHTINVYNVGAGGGGAAEAQVAAIVASPQTSVSQTGITVGSGGSGSAVTLATPTYIGGLTFVRAG